MAAQSHISWTTDTFNPWIGCTKVGPACDGCYADAMMGQGGRYKRATWGGPGQRAVLSKTSPSNWKLPLKWNREVAADRLLPVSLRRWPTGRFVFCASLADVFDKDAPAEWRRELFDLIRATPNLTWLLLTKRPQMIVKLYEEAQRLNADGTRWTSALPPERSAWPSNAAIGCTVVTQAEADRDVPHLLKAKLRLNPSFAFLSVEPMLGAIDLVTMELPYLPLFGDKGGAYRFNALLGRWGAWEQWGAGEEGYDGGIGRGPLIDGTPNYQPPFLDAGVDWVITGGETDQGQHKARPTNPQWFRSLRDQCLAHRVAYHHKQNGEWVSVSEVEGPGPFFEFPDGRCVRRVGKKKSGRTIDGAVHDARPSPAPAPVIGAA